MKALRVCFWFLIYFYLGGLSLGEGKDPRVEMLTGGQELVLNRGDTFQLECKFVVSDMNQFNLFDNPISWRKIQLSEEFQINMMSNILEPFAHLLRFSVLYHFVNFTHHFTLLVANTSTEDSANYTCVIQGPKNAVLAYIEHRVSVREQVTRVDLLFETPSSTPGSSADEPPQHDHRSRLVMSSPPRSSDWRPRGLEESGPRNSPAALYFHENRVASGIMCTCYGGYPVPAVSVLLGPRNVTHHFVSAGVKLHVHGDKGFRRLSFKSSLASESLIIRPTDDGEPLTCQATVQGLEPVRVTRVVHVTYGPLIRCQNSLAHLGQANVHLRCEVRAKPEVTSLFWVVDVNKTAITGSRTDDEFWNLVRVKQDGTLEVQLHIKKVTGEHFRNYVLVAENAISVQTQSIKLFPKTSQHPTSNSSAEETVWNFPKVQNYHNYFLRYFSKNVASSLIASLRMVATYELMRIFYDSID